MTMKDKLRAELLAKVKEGVKPSDLKKQNQNQAKRPISPSPMSIDEGYSSDPQRTPTPSDDGYSSDGTIDGQHKDISIAPPLANQMIKELQAQIISLTRQIQTYKDFKEADLKIKEDYKKTISQLQAKNTELSKTITDLQNQSKDPVKVKEEPQPKTFHCSECNQQKPQSELSRAFNKFSFCLECSKQARLTAAQQKEPPVEEFICHLCHRGKKEVPTKMKLDETLQPYLVCQECRPHAKEFNEADLITDDL
jgi:hypothetical protein